MLNICGYRAPEHEWERSWVMAMTESVVIDGHAFSMPGLSVSATDTGVVVPVSISDGEAAWLDNHTSTLLNFFTSEILACSLTEDSRWARYAFSSLMYVGARRR